MLGQRGRGLAVRLMRGGTSKGVFVHGKALSDAAGLPDDDDDDAKVGLSARMMRSAAVEELLVQLLGSEPSGMQLDGLGGSVSSTSKVAVMNRNSSMSGVADYLFGQVALKSPEVDWEASCGNLAAAAGLFARDEGIVKDAELLPSHFSHLHVAVPVWQANAGYLMHVHIPSRNTPVPREDWISIAGVHGVAPPILVEIIDPNKGQPYDLFPSGHVVDELSLLDGRVIEATLLRAANPTIFIRASDIGLEGHELPGDLPYVDQLLPQVTLLMEQAANLMGMRSVTSAMRVCWVSRPQDYAATDSSTVLSHDIDIVSRITTEGRVHHAHTGTGALNLGVAAAVPGTIVAQALGDEVDLKHGSGGTVRIGHPAGTLSVSAKVEEVAGKWRAESCGMVRTARTLIEGIAPL